MTRSWCNQEQIQKWKTTETTNRHNTKSYGKQNKQLFVDLKLFVANAYSNANALANFAKPMH